MANMAPGFLIWLAKTNCFSLSTNPCQRLFYLFYININPQSLPTSASPSQFSHQIFCKISKSIISTIIYYTFYPNQNQHNATKKKQYKEKKTLSHTLYPCTTSLLFSIFFLPYHYTRFPCFLCSSSSGYWVPLFCIFERLFGVPICWIWVWEVVLALHYRVVEGSWGIYWWGGFEWGLRGPWLIEKEETFVNCQEKPLPAATQGGTGGGRGRSRRFRSFSRLARLSLPLQGQALSLPMRTLTSCSLF